MPQQQQQQQRGVEEGEENGDEFFFDPDLFVNRATKLTSYVIDGLAQPLLASVASTTDHDLTGQIVWPVSIYLAWFVARNRWRFDGQQMLELGAGAGLPGMVASRFAGGALLTDGNELVLELLQQNVDRQRADGFVRPGARLEARRLLWGDEASLDAALAPAGDGGGGPGWRPQVLLGADVVAWPDMVKPLLQTTKALFLRAAEPAAAVLYLGFVNRATATERLLYATAAEMGMVIKRIPPEVFLPSPLPPDLQVTQQLELLAVALDDGSPRALEPVVFEAVSESRATPC